MIIRYLLVCIKLKFSKKVL